MKIKKILMIHSAHYDHRGQVVRGDKLIDQLTVANVIHMALPLLAAYVPKHIEVKLVEDCFEEVPWDDTAEVVAISAQVMQVERARDIAKKFRSLGKIVLMGGYLPTMHPELVQDDCDAICIGEGEEVFQQMLRDIENGTLKKTYHGGLLKSIDNIPSPRFDIVKKDRMILYPVQATRGCPFRCEFCSIIEFHQKTYRHRPIQDIIRDIKAIHSPFIFFTDDNLLEDIEFSKKLMREMIPLKVQWGTQTTINCANDSELLDLAYQAGCRWLAIGMESLDQDSLQKVNKGFNRVSKFTDQIKKIHQHGIAVHALVIFGLDGDTPQTFKNWLTYLDDLNISVAEFFTCTPYPKTPMGKKYWDEGRVIDKDLSHFREGYIVIRHDKMSGEEILREYWKTFREFYKLKNIFKRHWKADYKNKIYHLVTALFYAIKVRRNIIPVYFGQGNEKI